LPEVSHDVPTEVRTAGPNDYIDSLQRNQQLEVPPLPRKLTSAWEEAIHRQTRMETSSEVEEHKHNQHQNQFQQDARNHAGGGWLPPPPVAEFAADTRKFNLKPLDRARGAKPLLDALDAPAGS